MPYADAEGFYLNGRFIGGGIVEAERALHPETRRRLIRQFILETWDLEDVARWYADDDVPDPDNVAYFALDYIKRNHGYEGSGRPIAGISYRVVNRSDNRRPKTPAKKKAPAKKSANRAPARRY